SPAVELFVERARAGNPAFEIRDEAEAEIVTEVCRRLDGIALAIELAAARMVSMTPREVRDRLDDRFRLLSASRRGLGHQRTLRQTVQWSYDLLDERERSVLQACAVFADGFELAAASRIGGPSPAAGSGEDPADLDDYEVLDVLDSLVRRSLVVVEARG